MASFVGAKRSAVPPMVACPTFLLNVLTLPMPSLPCGS